MSFEFLHDLRIAIIKVRRWSDNIDTYIRNQQLEILPAIIDRPSGLCNRTGLRSGSYIPDSKLPVSRSNCNSCLNFGGTVSASAGFRLVVGSFACDKSD